MTEQHAPEGLRKSDDALHKKAAKIAGMTRSEPCTWLRMRKPDFNTNTEQGEDVCLPRHPQNLLPIRLPCQWSKGSCLPALKTQKVTSSQSAWSEIMTENMGKSYRADVCPSSAGAASAELEVNAPKSSGG